jgi:predicted short-subunit dehydrogenase-like oxidoreductase (DUF2520 family)
MKTLNVIGCGKVGKTMTRLWIRHQVFVVGSILNRSLRSAQTAVEFVGGGRAVPDLAHLGRTDVVMISTWDKVIADCCRQLADSELLGPGTIVFHCSGSLPSGVLAPAQRRGAAIASLHPVKSFADPSVAEATFAGTFCALEGDATAVAVLQNALARCGARTFPVDPNFKTIYHAAPVFASNYLVALVEIGVRCFAKAGVSRETALAILEPLVAGTVSNVVRLGPAAALTGPIARGEPCVVAQQAEALRRWDENLQEIYVRLGQIALELATAQGLVSVEDLAAIKDSLQR